MLKVSSEELLWVKDIDCSRWDSDKQVEVELEKGGSIRLNIVTEVTSDFADIVIVGGQDRETGEHVDVAMSWEELRNLRLQGFLNSPRSDKEFGEEEFIVIREFLVILYELFSEDGGRKDSSITKALLELIDYINDSVIAWEY